MSTWQEKAREKAEWAIHGYWCQEAVCGVCGDQFEDSAERALADAIIAALAPVVEAEVRRGQAEALRDVQAAIRERKSSPPSAVLSKAERAAWTMGMARAHAIVRDTARAIEAGDPR